MFAYVVLVNWLLVTLNWVDQQPVILLVSALVSSVYYAWRATHQKAGYGWSKAASGQAPHQLAYLLWLYCFPKNEYIFYIPLALSIIGKLILLLGDKSEDSLQKAQQLILFQVKCEAFILGFLFLGLLDLQLISVAQFLTFGALVKAKYGFYYPSQKAFVELHFAFDNLTRKWGFRPLYHLLYMGITVFSSTYGTDRELTY